MTAGRMLHWILVIVLGLVAALALVLVVSAPVSVCTGGVISGGAVEETCKTDYARMIPYVAFFAVSAVAFWMSFSRLRAPVRAEGRSA